MRLYWIVLMCGAFGSGPAGAEPLSPRLSIQFPDSSRYLHVPRSTPSPNGIETIGISPIVPEHLARLGVADFDHRITFAPTLAANGESQVEATLVTIGGVGLRRGPELKPIMHLAQEESISSSRRSEGQWAYSQKKLSRIIKFKEQTYQLDESAKNELGALFRALNGAPVFTGLVEFLESEGSVGFTRASVAADYVRGLFRATKPRFDGNPTAGSNLNDFDPKVSVQAVTDQKGDMPKHAVRVSILPLRQRAGDDRAPGN